MHSLHQSKTAGATAWSTMPTPSLHGHSSQAAVSKVERLIARRSWRYLAPTSNRTDCVVSHAHLSAVGGPVETAKQASQGELPAVGTFRFWHDERRFKGSGEKSIVQQALYEVGGVRTGGYPKSAPVPGALGAERPTEWDMLWSPARSALKATPYLKPGQLICAVPGMAAITRKSKLVPTLKEALGDDAFRVIPESYVLPSEHTAWSQKVEKDPGRLWMLKTGQHLGKGLKLLPGREAVTEALKPRPNKKPYVVAQHYVNDPLLIDGCKFGIRVWVVVTGLNPFRAYIHANGLVLFSTDQYDDSEWETEEGAVSEGHVTNYAQNVNGRVWNLKMLREHLGNDAYQGLWQTIVQNTALTFSAALGSLRKETASSNLPPNSTFEVMGLDYLVDTKLHPWLLEVNGTPSLAVEHADPVNEKIIHDEKMGMVRDMVKLLGIRDRFAIRYFKRANGGPTPEEARLRQLQLAGLGPDGSPLTPVLQELKQRGKWLPLMPHFRDVHPGGPIPWSKLDQQLNMLLARARKTPSSSSS